MQMYVSNLRHFGDWSILLRNAMMAYSFVHRTAKQRNNATNATMRACNRNGESEVVKRPKILLMPTLEPGRTNLIKKEGLPYISTTYCPPTTVVLLVSTALIHV